MNMRLGLASGFVPAAIVLSAFTILEPPAVLRSPSFPFPLSLVPSGRWLFQRPAQPPESAYRANNIGVAQLEQYDFEAAAVSFRDALKAAPGLAIARLNLAIALFYGGNADGAATEARAAAEQLPQTPQAQYMLGLIARAQDRVEDAVAAFQRVADMDQSDAGSRVNLGQLFVQQRRMPEAIAAFRAALTAEPYNATAAYGLATALIRAGEADEGRQAMQRFQTLRDSVFATTYSSTYLEQGRYAEAIASTGAEPELVNADSPDVRLSDDTTATFKGAPAPASQPGASPFGRQLAAADFTAEGSKALARELSGSVTLFDADGDADLDLAVAGPDGFRLYENSGSFVDVTGKSRITTNDGVPIGAVAGDYDNDGRADLFILGYGRNWLWHSNAGGTFEDASKGLPQYCCLARSAAFVDLDHDGDLDIFIAGLADLSTKSEGASGFPSSAAPARNQALRNNGNGTFADITAEAGLGTAGRGVSVVPTDFDNRRDVDILIANYDGMPALFRNLRDGSFRDVGADVGLPKSSSITSVAAGDVNKDGYTDLYFGRASERGVFALSDGRERFATSDAPPETSGSIAAQFLDYDNDGLLDLFEVSSRSAHLFRNLGNRWEDVTRQSGLEELTKSLRSPVQSIAIGDLNADGYQDVIARLAGGELRRWGARGSRNYSLGVALTARVSNRSAAGAKVEVRAGSLRQKLERSLATPAAEPADLLFGLGPRTAADVVRVIWPSGILQSETNLSAPAGPASSNSRFSRTVLTELDRKPSSCPFLYTWNGSRFEFVTDFMGGGEMGGWLGPSTWTDPDPDEYVRIPPDLLRPRDGRYELRVTNELEEVLFVDRLQLVAVDHPAEVSVFPNEGLRSAPRPPFALTAVGDLRPPAAAVDEHGHDVRSRIAHADRRYVDDFALSAIRGYAEPHELTLDLGANADGVAVLMTGWTDYAFSTDNVAASQAGLTMKPPAVEVRDTKGHWRPVIEEMGFPVGRPQTVVVDLRGRLRPGEREIRIQTSMRIYWDQIQIGTARQTAPRVTRIDPVVADLAWRGFSAEKTSEGQPLTYDYHDVSAASPWKVPVGRYTREGDVRELLRARDDQFVISKPGDQIALSLDVASLPVLPSGWTRTLLLYAYGYSKEMNIRSASPDTVGPLPFFGMTGYPYGPTEHHPQDEARRQYDARYNTRIVNRAVPSIDATMRVNR
jgi:tetratricopeptide (TPR) repeat protein